MMNIVHFNSGLGNQIMEYIFMRHLDLIRGEKNTFVDDMWFELYTNSHNGFELRKDIFPNIKMNMLKDCFDEDVWQNMVDIFKDRDNVFYMGVWFYEKYGFDIKKEIEHELQFTPLIHEENIKYKETILSKDYSVGLHVRRGDFLVVERHQPIEKYTLEITNLIKELADENIKPSFFIFSDDLDWCKENIDNFGFGDCLISLKLSSFALSAQMISPKPIKLIRIS